MIGVVDAFGAKRAVERILAEHGPLREDDIARRLEDIGVADADDVLDEIFLETDCPAVQLLDQRWVSLPTVLAGRVFTHRLGAGEAAYDMLTVTPNLNAITSLCAHEEYACFIDGSAARVAHPDYDDELLEQRGIPEEVVDPTGVLLLNPGTLQALGVADGDLVGLRLNPDGLAVEPVDESKLAADATVGASLAAAVGPDEPISFDAAVWTACVEDPAAFTEPLPPLSEIVDNYGLAYDNDWLAHDGFDFDRLRFNRGCAALAERHDLDPDDAFALFSLIQLLDRMSWLLADAAEAGELPQNLLAALAGDDTESAVDEFARVVGTLGAALADPLLAELLSEETAGEGLDGAAALGLLAQLLEPNVPQTAWVACRWLRAVALERLGDIDAAEQELMAAESTDPTWPLPLFDLARIASDRGDAERAIALLRRANAEPDHPLLGLLTQFRAEPNRDLGRNQPCWCGSGVKYKKCHLGREELPLSERVRWLYAKASQHAVANGWDDLLAEVGYERCRYRDDDEDSLEEALADPLLLDAVLFEGGAFQEFLEIRGSLLPEDERSLAEQWLLVERSVFEVEEVRRGEGVTVRDLRTGDTHDVREVAASRQLNKGQLVCARVVPAGDTIQFFGGIEPVALHDRDPLIQLLDDGPDAVTLVAALSRRFVPPTLVDTEGEPLAICEATVLVGDPAILVAALDEEYDRVDGEEPPQWLEYVTTQGIRRIRASLVLVGRKLQVEAISESRMDRVLDTLARLDPAVEVIDDIRRPLRDAREAAKLATELPTADEEALDPDDSQAAAALDAFMRDYETRWLDEAIPALHGFTPRRAADDPTRRGDLIKLLDSFPPGGSSSGRMDVDRLRAALGLE